MPGEWMVGLGQGIQQAGDVFSNALQFREKRRREDEAIQRALDQEARENDFRQQQLMLSGEQANTQRLLAESNIAQNEIENNRNAFNQALEISKNFPGAPLDDATAKDWLDDARAPMVHRMPGVGQQEMKGWAFSPAGRAGYDFNATQAGAKGDPQAGLGVLAHLADPSKGEAGPESFHVRQTESEKMRINAAQLANRTAIASQRDLYLRSKLQQDRQLAEMANSLGQERLRAMIDQAEAMIGFRYDNLSSEEAQRQAMIQGDIIEANIRAEAAKSNPMIGLLLGTQGQAGQPPAQTPPRPAPQAPQIIIPPRTGSGQPGLGGADDPGARPKPSGGTSLRDRLRNRAAAKGGQ